MAAGVILAFAVGAAASVLELRALGGTVPAALQATYDPARLERARAYAAVRIRFSLVAGGLRLAALLVFWGAGGFAWVDGWAAAVGSGPVLRGLAFLGTLGLLQALLALPARWYATFVLEQRFGFNRTTPAVFVADTARGLLMAVVLGGPLLAAALWLFARLGPAAWWTCWAAGTAWMLALQYVAPSWILPLWNRFTALRDGPLRQAIVAYAERIGFPLAGVFVIDGSRRSTKANAFFTGFGARKRIALFDTLVERHPEDEVVAVVAHEVGHHRLHHVPLGLALAIAQLGAAVFLLSLVLGARAPFAALGVAPSLHAAVVVFAILAAPFEVPLALASNALSRRHERQADAFAARTTGRGDALASALARLAADTLANPTPHPVYVALHHGHPPVAERISALQQM